MQVKVNFNGTSLLCDVDYQPFESATLEDPGCAEQVEVNDAIYIDSEGRACDVLELIASWCDVEAFEKCVINEIKKRD